MIDGINDVEEIEMEFHSSHHFVVCRCLALSMLGRKKGTTQDDAADVLTSAQALSPVDHDVKCL